MIILGLWALFMLLFVGVVIITEKIKEKKE